MSTNTTTQENELAAALEYRNQIYQKHTRALSESRLMPGENENNIRLLRDINRDLKDEYNDFVKKSNRDEVSARDAVNYTIRINQLIVDFDHIMKCMQHDIKCAMEIFYKNIETK